MSGVNGPDIAAVYQLLTEVAQQVGDIVRRLSEHDRRASSSAKSERRTLRLERHLGLPPLEPEGRIL